MSNIVMLETREKQIVWFEGGQQHPVIERTIETADRRGRPNDSEIGDIGPGLALYGYTELADRTGPNDKGNFQRRIFFRQTAKPGTALPGDRMMRPNAGGVRFVEDPAPGGPDPESEIEAEDPPSSDQRFALALERAGAYGDGSGQPVSRSHPDDAYGG